MTPEQFTEALKERISAGDFAGMIHLARDNGAAFDALPMHQRCKVEEWLSVALRYAPEAVHPHLDDIEYLKSHPEEFLYIDLTNRDDTGEGGGAE